MSGGDDDLMTVAEAAYWLSQQSATLMHRDGTAILLLDAGHMEAFRRLLADIALNGAARADLTDADLDPLLILFGLDPAAVRDAADLEILSGSPDPAAVRDAAGLAYRTVSSGAARMTIDAAVERIAARPGVLQPGDSNGTILVCGPAQLAALGKLLAVVDPDTVPDGPDLELFAMLTGAVRSAP